MILGIVCDDISSMVEEVRAGNYQIVEEGHTVVLNSNHQLGSILRQVRLTIIQILGLKFAQARGGKEVL